MGASLATPCELCGQAGFPGTLRCDRCWELEGRIRSDPELAMKVFVQLMVERLVKVMAERSYPNREEPKDGKA